MAQLSALRRNGLQQLRASSALQQSTTTASAAPLALSHKHQTMQQARIHVSTIARNTAGGVATAASGSSARSVIVKLLQNIGSKKEVEQYLKYYSSLSTPQFAVIKVGGGVIEDELDTLVESLSFLSDVGLLPVVLHGGGPQLNKDLESQGIVSEYHEGIRVTTPQILKTARKVFLAANNKLVSALEKRGTRAKSIVSGVFEAELLDPLKFQYVGNITKVNIEQVTAALELGQLPILTCMGETEFGQYLNVNADVGGQELAKALKPVKVVYISGKGGLKDNNNKLIAAVDLELDYETLMTQPWFRYGDRLKLREIKTLLDALPLSSSVAITSAENLPKELFTHKGSGTLIRRSEKIHVLPSLANVDLRRITKLIETAFDGKLCDSYLPRVAAAVHTVILTDSYNGLALVTLDKHKSNNPVPYLDKFAVSKQSQGEGTGQLLWKVLSHNCSQLYWRSRSSNTVNSWYFERAQGSYTDAESGWTVFWYGLESFAAAQQCVAEALAKPGTIDRSIKIQHDEHTDSNSSSSGSTILDTPLIKSVYGGVGVEPAAVAAATTAAAAATVPTGKRSYSTSTANGLRSVSRFSAASLTRQANKLYSRSFSSSSSSNNSKVPVTRIGLIGARGHTGAQLLSLIDRHSAMTVTVASSRALVGQTIGSVFAGEQQATATATTTATAAPAEQFRGVNLSPKFSSVVFVNLQPADLLLPAYSNSSSNSSNSSTAVDVWILALPNDLAAPYVAALQAAGSKQKVIDLSADYRFGAVTDVASTAAAAAAAAGPHAWQYGLPERHHYRQHIAAARYVANPGCYATGMQLSLLPLADVVDAAAAVVVFGVSGYSGAGTNPSRKNDPTALANNLMPYALVNHMHEREVSHQLSTLSGYNGGLESNSSSSSGSSSISNTGNTGIRFMPHVAPWFRGISLTIAVQLKHQHSVADVMQLYRSYYSNDRLVHVIDAAPEVAANSNKHHVTIGGVTIQGKRMVVCATIDNLLKGAATQAIQNINIMQGHGEYDGLLE